MTMNHALHRCSDTDSLYLPRSIGWAWIDQIIEEEKALEEYLNASEEDASTYEGLLNIKATKLPSKKGQRIE